MKLLLDESVPRHLAASFPAPLAPRTVRKMGWTGTGHDLLRSLAAREGFDARIDFDRGIERSMRCRFRLSSCSQRPITW